MLVCDSGGSFLRMRRVFGLVGAVAFAASSLGCSTIRRPDGGEGLLPVGSAAPDVRGIDQNGKTIVLRAMKKPTVVFFYPKDGTPGCTTEACAFRDAWHEYQAAGIVVLGVSTDDVASHTEFVRDERLPFSLVADTDAQWVAGFGVGTTLGLASRVSFLINGTAKVVRVYPDVDPGVHAKAVLEDARDLGLVAER